MPGADQGNDMRLSEEQIRERAGRWEELDGSLDMIGLLPAGPLHVSLTGFVSEAHMPERYPEGVSERKIGLFALACCRRIWPHFRDQRCRHAVEVAERYLEGQATREEMSAAYEAVRPLATCYDDDGPACAAAHLADVPWGKAGAQEVAEAAAWYAPSVATAFDEEMLAQAALLREVFGNPFREIVFDPAWRTPQVKALAEHIYQSQEFARLPELAELLEHAGCRQARLLEHCGRPGGHVRGCWALDLVLDKQ
jgi:hypothetical protein